MSTRRGGSLTLESATTVEAGVPVVQVPEHVPAPAPTVPTPTVPEPDTGDESDTSDFASKQASKRGGRPPALGRVKPAARPAITVEDLLGGLPEPERDLVPCGWRVPRYLAQTVELLARLSRRPQQDIVADLLREHLDERAREQVYRALYG